MKPEELLSVLHTANRLKDTTRHCWTPGNRHESVAGADGLLPPGRVPGYGYGQGH